MFSPTALTAVAVYLTPDAALAAHLAAWEKTMAATDNFHARIDLSRRNAVLNRQTHTTVDLLCRKPDGLRLRFERAQAGGAEPDGNDALTCVRAKDMLYEYDGKSKTLTEWPTTLPQPVVARRGAVDGEILALILSMMLRGKSELLYPPLWFGRRNLLFSILTARCEPGELARQCHVKLIKHDAHYVYLELTPGCLITCRSSKS